MNPSVWATVLLIATALFYPRWTVASPLSIECPSTISSKDVQIKGPAVWSVHVDEAGIALAGAGLMHGPPQEMAILRPTGAGRSNEEVWADIRPVEKGIWAACFYGQDQEIILSQRLPASIKECRILYAVPRPQKQSLSIRCR
jgi:hypothetical protein